MGSYSTLRTHVPTAARARSLALAHGGWVATHSLTRSHAAPCALVCDSQARRMLAARTLFTVAHCTAVLQAALASIGGGEL